MEERSCIFSEERECPSRTSKRGTESPKCRAWDGGDCILIVTARSILSFPDKLYSYPVSPTPPEVK